MTNTGGVTQLADFRFSSPDIPVLEISVRVSEIAERVGLTVETWEEDGLGAACGAIIRLPSGIVVLMYELEHLIKHHRAKGPVFDVGASDAVATGVEPLVFEILDSLGLPRDVIVWTADTKQLRARWSAWKP